MDTVRLINDVYWVINHRKRRILKIIQAYGMENTIEIESENAASVYT